MSILSQNFVNFLLFPLAFLLLLTQCSISVDAIRCWAGIGAKLEVNIHKLPPDVPMNVSLEHLQKLETIEFDGTVKGKVRCDFLVQKCMKTVCTGDAYSMNNMVINEKGSVLGDFVTLTKNPQGTYMDCEPEIGCSSFAEERSKSGEGLSCETFCCDGDLCNGATIGNHFGTFVPILVVGILNAFLFHFCCAM